MRSVRFKKHAEVHYSVVFSFHPYGKTNIFLAFSLP